MKLSTLSERKTLARLSAIGFLIVVAGAVVGEMYAPDGFKSSRIASTLIVALGGGLLVSCLVGLIVSLYQTSGERRDRQLLSEFFGVSDSSKEIAIVLPRFPSPTASQLPEPSVAAGKCAASIKDTRLTNKYSLAFDDIAAARHLGAIFVELGMSPPRFEFDDDAWQSLFGTDPGKDKLRHYKTLIVVGLYSNDVTMEFATRNDITLGRRFRLTSKQDFLDGKRGVAFQHDPAFSADWYTEARSAWDEQIESDVAATPEENERKRDFALISTCRAPDGRTCFIVGGGRSRGTRKAASYLRKTWRRLAQRTSSSSLEAPPLFVSVFDLDGKQGSKLRERGFYPA